MTKSEWERMYKEHKEKIDNCNNVYGNVYVGKLCVDFCHTKDEDAWYLYSNTFEMGKDTGYGETSKGIPYSLLDCDIRIPIRCKTFDSFKKDVEHNIKEMIVENHLEEQANAPLADWN